MANPNQIPAHIRALAFGDPPVRNHLFIGIRAALLSPPGSLLSFFRA